MNWILGGGGLIAVVLIAFFVFRSPSFWIGVVEELVSSLLPFINKRKSSEEEAKDRQEFREGMWKSDSRGHGHGGENH